MRIIIGIIGCAVGIMYIKYNSAITHATGSIGWAERHLGSGGTYSLHKLIGTIIILISILWITGTFQAILNGTLGRLVPGL